VRRAPRDLETYFGHAGPVASEDALDQYFMREPETLLGRRVEAAILDHANRRVLDGHVLAAAYEAPLDDADRALIDEANAILAFLELQGVRDRAAAHLPARRRQSRARSPDRALCAYVTILKFGFVVLTNSPAQLAHLAAVQDGKVPPLSGAPEYIFFRDRECESDPCRVFGIRNAEEALKISRLEFFGDTSRGN